MDEKIAVIRELLAVIKADRDQLQGFLLRVKRGDPRVCKLEYSNPKYFKKWGE